MAPRPLHNTNVDDAILNALGAAFEWSLSQSSSMSQSLLTTLRSRFTAKTLAPMDECSRLRRQGDVCVQKNCMEEAVGYYECALAINSHSLEACIGIGFAFSELGQNALAQEYLRRALSIEYNVADVHYMLGGVAKKMGQVVSAIEHYSLAIDIDPDLVFAHRDLLDTLIATGQLQLAADAAARAAARFPRSGEFPFFQGNLFFLDGAFDQAIACYRLALLIEPGAVQTHLPLANALAKSGQLDEAISHYQHAARDGPESATTQLSLGETFEKRGRRSDAITCYRRAVELEPLNAIAHYFLGNALLAQGEKQEARRCFEEVLRSDPDNSVSHLVAALSGRDTDRPPSEYVERLFDEYADKFDTHLVKVLQYSVPQALTALLSAYRVPGSDMWDILDLGCGTGLFGAAVAPIARHLVGVDLSTRMLEKARVLNLYHRLERMELLEMMQNEAPSLYDVISATDVFVYIGRLDALVAQARRLLRPGGFFAFSVESLDALVSPDESTEPRLFQLNSTGRYAHSMRYLAALASHHGFDVLTRTDMQFRTENGHGVEGYLTVWRRET